MKKSGCARGDLGQQGQPQPICISPGSARDSGGSCGFILNNHFSKTNASRAFSKGKKGREGGGVGWRKMIFFFFFPNSS